MKKIEVIGINEKGQEVKGIYIKDIERVDEILKEIEDRFYRETKKIKNK